MIFIAQIPSLDRYAHRDRPEAFAAGLGVAAGEPQTGKADRQHHRTLEQWLEDHGWNKPRRVVAKVEWHPGELCPRVGFIVTNLAWPAERVVAFYNHRGTCEQYIKEGKGVIK